MANNNPFPDRITPDPLLCRWCHIARDTADLLNDMQTANVPLIPTNDTINNIVDVIGRPNAKWSKEIAAEVIKIYDTIAPWGDRIDEIVGRCINTCDSIDKVERGQNPCNHVLYNWSVLISVYEDHAIAYREVTQPERATAEAATPATSPQPDFSHMNSYKPTIEFDMGELYLFLINECVITGIDEELFSDCITHARINELWKNGKHNQLRCTVRHLKGHYPPSWYEDVSRNLAVGNLTSFNRDTLGKFETKLRDLI